MEVHTIIDRSQLTSPLAPANSPAPLYDVNRHPVYSRYAAHTQQFRCPRGARRPSVASLVCPPADGYRAACVSQNDTCARQCQRPGRTDRKTVYDPSSWYHSARVSKHDESAQYSQSPGRADGNTVHGSSSGHHDTRSASRGRECARTKESTFPRKATFAKVYPAYTLGGQNVLKSAKELDTISSRFCVEPSNDIALNATGDFATETTSRKLSHKVHDVTSLIMDIPKNKCIVNRKPINISRVSSKVYPYDSNAGTPEYVSKERHAEIVSMFCVEGKQDGIIVSSSPKITNTSTPAKIYPCGSRVDRQEQMSTQKLKEIASMFCVEGKGRTDQRKVHAHHYIDIHASCPQDQSEEEHIAASGKHKNRAPISRIMQSLKIAMLGK